MAVVVEVSAVAELETVAVVGVVDIVREPVPDLEKMVQMVARTGQ